MKTQRLQAGWGAFLVCLLLTVAPVGFLTACRPVAPDAEAETADRRTSAESVEEAIARLVTEAAVSEAYQMLLGEKPERYTFDSAAYLLEYMAPWDYWDRVQGADYGEWVAPLQETAPDVYIPLRGDIADTAAVVSNRVIGYIKLQYRPLHQDYTLRVSLYNLSSEPYRDRQMTPFLEAVTDYLAANGVREACLLRFPNSLTDGQETVAVMRMGGETVVLDASDSLHRSPEVPWSEPAVVYPAAEYRRLRMALEPTLYSQQSVDDRRSER